MYDLAAASSEALVQVLEGNNRDRRMAAMAELARRGRGGDLRGAQSLVDVLDRYAQDTEGENGRPSMEAATEMEYAVDSLESIGPPIVDLLLATLLDQERSPFVRSGATNALGNIGDPRAYDALVTILLDNGEEVSLRSMVAFYIGRLRDHRAVGPLLDIAADVNQDRTIRRNAIYALGELRDPESFDVLMSLLPDPEVHIAASTALADLRDWRAVDRLLPTLASDDDSWRFSVAVIVGKVGESAVMPLLALLTSPDWREREGSANGLGFTTDQRAAGPLTRTLQEDADGRVRRAAASSLGFLDDGSAAYTLVEALADADVQVRLASMSSLFHLALTGHAPTDIVSRVEWVANHDTGTINGHEVIKDVGQRTVRELRRALPDED